MSKKPFILLLCFVCAGLIVLSLASLGYYPIATVNGSFVSGRDFISDYRAASTYYQNFLTTYGDKSSGAVQKLGTTDIEQAVLSELIENRLIAREARAEIGANFDALLEAKVSAFDHDAKLQEAARTLYGLGPADFAKKVIVPQAERDLLTAKLFLRGKQFDAWLTDAKRNASVRIFSGKFYWDGESVKISK